jgi:hypothetical protein
VAHDPGVFPGDAGDRVGRFQARGQDIVGIRFHFEVAAVAGAQALPEGGGQVPGGDAELCIAGPVERDVEVNAQALVFRLILDDAQGIGSPP